MHDNIFTLQTPNPHSINGHPVLLGTLSAEGKTIETALKALSANLRRTSAEDANEGFTHMAIYDLQMQTVTGYGENIGPTVYLLGTVYGFKSQK